MVKELTKDAVEKTAILLIEANPENTTTTLEVKNLLRYLGYSATQERVSEYMKSFTKLEYINIVIKGKECRLYRLSTDALTPKFEFYRHRDEEINHMQLINDYTNYSHSV